MRRRTILTTVPLLALSACAAPSSPPAPAPTTPPLAPALRVDDLESRFGARLGVWARDTGSGAEVAHRADERFAFCSTFKMLAAAAVLRDVAPDRLDAVVRYSAADLMTSGRVTRDHVATGMTLRELCDAAVRFSDGTAGNLLMREVGGPAGLTAFARSIGDEVTRVDRTEPELAQGAPGEERDTSSPRALGQDMQRIVLGDVLATDRRDFLADPLVRNTTGDARVRAGVPAGRRVADKTGTGGYGTANDVAVVWPPGRAPIVVALMSTMAQRYADVDEALLAEAAGRVMTAFTGPG
ncbi:MAG: class A beta-lactamase [Pseudonocardiaceae bacterium]|nr:MAG: class A beta-lactamase [Pseudonocardiaceae bacterium]